MVACDCKWAGEENSNGLHWCEKKQIYVTGKEQDTCEFFEKG
ncbi:MAG: hypothetical protein ACTSVV_05210 [Promethearchaeota archaeon]